MPVYKYSTLITDTCAKAVGLSLPVSRKDAIMICKALRYKPLSKAKKLLEEVQKLETAIPFTRYCGDRGHKPGMAAGRYPIKACTYSASKGKGRSCLSQ